MVIKILDTCPDPGPLEMLDPDPDSMNPDLQLLEKEIFVRSRSRNPVYKIKQKYLVTDGKLRCCFTHCTVFFQVTAEYYFDKGACIPVRVHTVVVSVQHSEKVKSHWSGFDSSLFYGTVLFDTYGTFRY